MKKIKLISSIAAIATVSTTMVALVQCTKSSDIPVIDPQVSDKCNIETSKDEQNNVISNVKLKTDIAVRHKITSVAVTIGDKPLTENTDYKTEFTNASGVKVIIYKKTLDTYKGNIVIKPVIVTKEVTGITVECDKTEFKVGTTMTTNNVKVYEILDSTTKGNTINWTTAVELYLDGQKVDNFLTNGYTFSTAKEYNFTVKYQNFTASFKVTAVA